MISLLAAAFATCVPLADADRFGDIRFDERVSADDPRYTSIVCDPDGCTGQDQYGAEYRTNGERFLQKVVAGHGPSSAFAARLTPESPESQVLTTPVCVEDGGVWLELDLTAADRPTYGLFSQP